MVKNDFIDSTKLALLNSFKDKIDFHADFITDQLLSKPPFGFLQTLVRLYVTELCFAKGLFTEEELRYQKRLPRSEKVKVRNNMFLHSMPNEMECLTLCKYIRKLDVENTHYFLRSLAKASTEIDISHEAVKTILKDGEIYFYKRSVRTRITIIKIQARIRGIQLRNKLKEKSLNKHINVTHRNDEKGSIPKTSNSEESCTSYSKSKDFLLPTSKILPNAGFNAIHSYSQKNIVDNQHNLQEKEDYVHSVKRELLPVASMPVIQKKVKCGKDTQLKDTSSQHHEIPEQDIELDFQRVQRDLKDQVVCLNIVMRNEKNRQKIRLRERLVEISECNDRGYHSGPSSSEKRRHRYGPPFSAPTCLSPSKMTNKRREITSGSNSDCSIQFTDNSANTSTGAKQLSCKALKFRYKAKIKELKEKENMLSGREEDLGQKSQKITKLANSLRRQFCQMKRERENLAKEAEQAREKQIENNLRRRIMHETGINLNASIPYRPKRRVSTAPCVKCCSVVKRKDRLKDREYALQEKESRVLRLANSLRRQQRKLEKEKKEQERLHEESLISRMNAKSLDEINTNKNKCKTFQNKKRIPVRHPSLHPMSTTNVERARKKEKSRNQFNSGTNKSRRVSTPYPAPIQKSLTKYPLETQTGRMMESRTPHPLHSFIQRKIKRMNGHDKTKIHAVNYQGRNLSAHKCDPKLDRRNQSDQKNASETFGSNGAIGDDSRLVNKKVVQKIEINHFDSASMIEEPSCIDLIKKRKERIQSKPTKESKKQIDDHIPIELRKEVKNKNNLCPIKSDPSYPERILKTTKRPVYIPELMLLSQRGKIAVDTLKRHLLERIKISQQEANQIVCICLKNLETYHCRNKHQHFDVHKVTRILQETLQKKQSKTWKYSKQGNKYKEKNEEDLEMEILPLNQHVEHAELSSDVCNEWKATFDSQMESALEHFEEEYGLRA